MLQDLALAFHPDDGPTATFSRKWLRDVRAGEPIGGVADCVEINQCVGHPTILHEVISRR